MYRRVHLWHQIIRFSIQSPFSFFLLTPSEMPVFLLPLSLSLSLVLFFPSFLFSYFILIGYWDTRKSYLLYFVFISENVYSFSEPDFGINKTGVGKKKKPKNKNKNTEITRVAIISWNILANQYLKPWRLEFSEKKNRIFETWVPSWRGKIINVKLKYLRLEFLEKRKKKKKKKAHHNTRKELESLVPCEFFLPHQIITTWNSRLRNLSLMNKLKFQNLEILVCKIIL